jgi:hypothetical protein
MKQFRFVLLVLAVSLIFSASSIIIKSETESYYWIGGGTSKTSYGYPVKYLVSTEHYGTSTEFKSYSSRDVSWLNLFVNMIFWVAFTALVLFVYSFIRKKIPRKS